MRIFIFSISHHFPTYFGLKWTHNGIFFIFEFFCYFVGIFNYATGRNGTEWEFLFSLFPIIFQPIFAWNEAIMVFFSFSNFFYGIFYFASGRNKTERYFLYSLFPGIFHPILAWYEAIVVIFNFFNFFAILLEFSIMRPAGTERNENFYFLSFSSFSNLFWLERNP